MDYYKILKIDSNATEKEIEEAYKLLSSTYDPMFNTSPIAYKRYREVQLAYKMLQNKKVLNFQEEQDNLNLETFDTFDYEKYFNKKENSTYVSRPLEEKNNYLDIKYNDKIILPNFNYKKEISVDYLEVLLNCKLECVLYQKQECDHATKKECNLCNGIGKVSYQNEIILCPKCKGKKVIKECDCHNHSYIKTEKKITLDLTQMNLNKPNLILDTIVTFNIINKDKVKVYKDRIEVVYDLSKEEVLSGFKKRYLTDSGLINIETKDFDNDLIIPYKDTQIVIHFNKISYDGDDITKTMLFDRKDLNKTLYLNLDNLTYSETKDQNHLHRFVLKEMQGTTTFSNKGEKGYLEGKDGDLILNYIACSGYHHIDNKPIQIEETSYLYNLFGGKGNIGFKGKNYLVEKENYILILTGNSKKKDYISNYLWIKLFIYLCWILLPMIILLAPISKQLLLSSCIVTISYSILANILLRLKI